MSLEGEIVVRLAWDGQRVSDVRICSTRSAVASRLLVGRSPGDARTIVPALYSVCAAAHAAAADVALAAAAAGDPASLDLDTPSRGVLLEVVTEHVKSLLFDWPRTFGRLPNAAAVARARRLTQRLQHEPDPADARTLESIAAEFVYGTASARWAGLTTVDELQRWAEEAVVEPAQVLRLMLREHATLGASDIGSMPAVNAITLRDPLAPSLRTVAEFERYPTWNGVPMETGALARLQAHPLVRAMVAWSGNSVASRFVARLVELALALRQCAGETAQARAVEAFTDESGAGVAAVQTARGLLLHRACVEDGRISGYTIVAPTEWNFHPDGALASGLRGCEAGDEEELRACAAFTVQALDPCVATRIEVGHA